ncbi:MAG: asparagine synthase, partial [Saprospiraceae bacterium]|nr:asparagine synthase [Saprospiraceae bacterium]
LLCYADTNSMAFSKEIRLPFLSKDVVEFCFSLPEEFLINRNWTKFLLRKAMQNTLPEKITWRKDKIGFTASSLDWHKHHLWQNTLQISLHRLCELGYLDQKILNQSCALKADEIWRIILGCAWIERFS